VVTVSLDLSINDLSESNLWDVASFCLRNPEQEEWFCKGDCERIREAWRRKKRYLSDNLSRGARAKIAYLGSKPVGFIEYYPIEACNLEVVGRDISVIWCINVLGQYSGRGIGSRLLRACIEGSRESGFKGVATTSWDPFWMPSGFFKKHGFIEISPAGSGKLLFYRLADDAEPPLWVGRGRRYDGLTPVEGKVAMDIFHSDRCPIHWRNTSLILEIAKKFGDRIHVRFHNTDDRCEMLRHKIQYAVYLEGRAIAMGPLAKADEVRARIREAFAQKGL